MVDVVQVLMGSDYQAARKYWKVLKGRIVQEAGQPVTICYQFKMRAADGKMRLTDVADQAQLFRIIQSVPSPLAHLLFGGNESMPVSKKKSKFWIVNGCISVRCVGFAIKMGCWLKNFHLFSESFQN